ncbi:unnamed protein product [Moneuplotes crassus]|uniref:CSC1/OSCA1-like 7TM region domain-containing protein n=1 Tax=Euplotes crassus TaxID=5936 RepID=A0AAD2D4I8_EUPCR|nr:unnamed protein product [Moneuplotes crassus]
MYEGHDTYTSYTLSLTIKMVTTLYINTAIIPLCVNYEEKFWFSGTGLIADIFYNTLAICFLSPLMYLFDPFCLLKTCKRWKENKKGEKSKLTQRQFNELFEGQEMSLESKYTSAFLILLVCCTYTVLLPILPLICCIGIIYQYCIVKWILVKKNKRPKEIGYFMDISASNIFIVVILINGISVWYFLTRLSDGKNLLAYIPFIVAGISVILPFNYLEKKFKIYDVEDDDNITWNSVINFPLNYKNCNPALSDGGLTETSSTPESEDSSISEKEPQNRLRKLNLCGVTNYLLREKNNIDQIIWDDLGAATEQILARNQLKNSVLLKTIKTQNLSQAAETFQNKISRTQGILDPRTQLSRINSKTTSKKTIKSLQNSNLIHFSRFSKEIQPSLAPAKNQNKSYSRGLSTSQVLVQDFDQESQSSQREENKDEESSAREGECGMVLSTDENLVKHKHC